MDVFGFVLSILIVFLYAMYVKACQGETFDIAHKNLQFFGFYQIQSVRSQVECVKHCKKDKGCGKAYYWMANCQQCFLTGTNNTNVKHLAGDEDLIEMTRSSTSCGTDEDCAALFKRGYKQDGVYTLRPTDGGKRVKVYCDMTTDGGGWTVFQTRKDGSEDFFRGWYDYKNGFGNLTGEFWLGNDILNRLTSQDTYKLRVDMEDWDGDARYAVYDTFSIASEGDNYTLSIGAFSGDTGDSLTYRHGFGFTTKDRDNDAKISNCAVDRTGAWWYKSCNFSNLNGLYQKGGTTSSVVSWYKFKGYDYSLKTTSMKFRPVGFKNETIL